MDLFGGHIEKVKPIKVAVKFIDKGDLKVKEKKVNRTTKNVEDNFKVNEPKQAVESIVKESTSILMTVATQYARKLGEGYNYIIYKAGDGVNSFCACFETYAFSETGAQSYCASKNRDGCKYFYKDIKEVILDLKKSDDSYLSWRKIK